MITQQDYWLKPGETPDQYTARISALRTADNQTNMADTAKSAGAAGIGLGDLSGILGKTDTTAVKDDLAKQYGYTDYNTFVKDIFSKPSKSSEQLFNDAYGAAGLDSVLAQINDKKAKLNEAIGAVGENPWLSEASRVGRTKRLQELANADISNLTDQYNSGLEKVKNLVQLQTNDFTQNQQINQQRLDYLTRAAEAAATQQKADTLAQYLPDYLKGKVSTEKPITVELPEGQAMYQYDKATGQFKLIGKNAKTYAPNTTPNGDQPQLYSGLSSTTATAVRGKVSNFKAEPVAQNFATVQDGYMFANSLSNTTTNPADDQALIYSLAKALDPGSVVREGEYATAQKYAQSWVAAFGKSVSQAIYGTGFLSNDARANIKKTIEQKYNATKKSYDNLYKQYVSGINQLTGRADGANFLTDYAVPQSGTSDYTSKLDAILKTQQ